MPQPRMTDAPLVIDVQRDFMPSGALAVPDGDAVIAPINRLLAYFPHAIATQDWHPPGHASFASTHAGTRPFEATTLTYGKQILWPDHCIIGTAGAEFGPGLDLRRVELVLRKGFRPEIDSYSGFRENDRITLTGLHGYLTERGLRRLFLAGLARDYCVHYTTVDALAFGYEVIVVEDACRAIDPTAVSANKQRCSAPSPRSPRPGSCGAWACSRRPTPAIQVRVLTTTALVSVGPGVGAAGVVIRHGLGRYSGLDAVRLL